MANSKLDVDKLDIGNLKTTPIYLSKLNKAVKNVVKKTVYNKLSQRHWNTGLYLSPRHWNTGLGST